MSSTANVTRAQFAASTASVKVTLPDGTVLECAPREFSTGSLGYQGNGKATVTLADGTVLRCQVGLTITVIGSKALPRSA